MQKTEETSSQLSALIHLISLEISIPKSLEAGPVS